MTNELINNVYQALAIARAEYFAKSEELIGIKTALDDDKRNMRTSGEITGKNDTEREDCAFSKLTNEYHILRQYEAAERLAKFNLDQALAEVERVRLLQRAAETTSKEIEF